MLLFFSDCYIHVPWYTWYSMYLKEYRGITMIKAWQYHGALLLACDVRRPEGCVWMGGRVFSARAVSAAVGSRSFERVNERSVGGFLAGLHTLVPLCGQQSLKHHSHSRLPPVHAWSTRWRSQGMEKGGGGGEKQSFYSFFPISHPSNIVRLMKPPHCHRICV